MSNRLRDAFSGSARSSFAARSPRRMRLRQRATVAANAEVLEPRQLLTAWVSTDPVGVGSKSMYVVYDSESGDSGVMYNGVAGSSQSGVCYKVSDASTQPVRFASGTILGAVSDICMDNNDSAPDEIVVFVDGDHLRWAYNADTPLHEIGSSALSGETDIANFSSLGDRGFYFSSYSSSGAKLWSALHTTDSNTFTLSSYDMTLTANGDWGTDTHIAWITAVDNAYDVMFSGDMPVDGEMLMGSDGTSVDLITTTDGIISPANVAVNGTLYFATAANPTSALWKSDGDPNHTIAFYTEEELPWEGGSVSFRQVAGMDGYLDAGPDGDFGTTDDKTYVFFWLAEVNYSFLWRTDGTPYDPDPDVRGPSPTPITFSNLDYCPGPKIPGQGVGNRPFVIVKEPDDPLYGTVYFTAGIANDRTETVYSLYKINPPHWSDPLDPPPSATWLCDSGRGTDSPCAWLTVVETDVGGGAFNHKLYFRAGEPENTTNMRWRELNVYDPQATPPDPFVSGVDLMTLYSVPDMNVSWLVYDQYTDRLYYFSQYGVMPSNTNLRLCWWDRT